MATPTVYVICDQKCLYEGMTKEQILAAIMQAVNEGTIGDIDTGFVTTIKTINNTPLKFFVGEQAEYDALTDDEKQNLFAIITNDTTKEGIIASIEQLTTDLYEFRDGIIDGSVTAKNAENAEYATRDAQGNTITTWYLADLNAPKLLKNYTLNTALVAGDDNKVRVGNKANLVGSKKMLNQIMAVSFTLSTGDKFYGLKSAEVFTDDNGSYVEFACSRVMRKNEYGYYYWGTAYIKIHEIDGIIYISLDDYVGMIRSYSDGTWTDITPESPFTSANTLTSVYLYFA